MSLSLLGDQIDIHGGGQDVIFPHHENEIAQSETYTGLSPFVRFWVHNGLLRLTEDDTEKMSRHVGNFISCRDALAQHNPDTLRLYFFSSHYRSPLTFSDEGVTAADRALERLRNALRPGARRRRGRLRGRRRIPRPLHLRHGRRPQHAPGPRLPFSTWPARSTATGRQETP